MLKIDKKDEKILYSLSKNARISISQLSKDVALSREVTNYRLQRLIKKGIVVDFVTDIDEEKLGFGRHLIYFALQNVDAAREKEIIAYLVSHPFVSWTTTSVGKWSVVFDFLAESLVDVHFFLQEFQETFSSCLAEHIVASQIAFAHFHSKYYKVERRQKIVRKQKQIPHKVDKKDLLILKNLSNNARMDYVDLAKQLKMVPNSIRNRIKTLQKAGVIRGFFVVPNKRLLGYQQYYIQLDFINQATEQEEKLISFIREHKNMNAYYKPLGHWSIEIAVFVRNVKELREIILDLRNNFGAFIRIRDTMLFYEEPKSNYSPKGVFHLARSKSQKS